MSLVSWMVYAVAVGLLLAGAAWFLELVLNRLGLPTRWVWLAALGLSVGIPFGAAVPWLTGAFEGFSTVPPPAMEGPEGPSPGVEATRIGQSDVLRFAALSGVPARTLDGAIAGAAAILPDRPAAEPWIRGIWAMVTLTLSGMVFRTWVLLARWRRTWPRSRVRGRLVWISPDLGPAVMGVVRPEIVLPRWAVGLSAEDLDLLLAHEGEHVRAWDSLLLAGGLGCVLLIPWNPALWWQLRRLRDAIEVDCDRRVLRRGASPRRYAGLLVRVGAGTGRSLVPAPALSGTHSLLQRRLYAMRQGSTRIGVPQTLAAGAVSACLLVLACEADTPALPTDATPGAGDVAEVAADAGATGPADGHPSSQEVVLWDLPPSPSDAPIEDLPPPAVRSDAPVAPVRVPDPADPRVNIIFRQPSQVEPPLAVGLPDGPLFILDGVILENREAVDLEALSIESIEVIRGAAAASLYGPRASQGVVLLRTHDSGRQGRP